MQAETIIQMISQAKKKTKARAFIQGDLRDINWKGLKYLGTGDFGMVSGEYDLLMEIINSNSQRIRDYDVEVKARNSALPLADLTRYDARIEPGAIIRDMVEIGKGAVIMMGAVINIGCVIGDGTMIDMNAVLGGRAIIGSNCHIGAGAVLAGVIEPPSAQPVVVEDNVLIGANAVILEGVKVGKGAVIAAGSVVTSDVPPFSVAAGTPAKIIKQVDSKTADKTRIVEDLRNL
ncbi:MAG: 2,3,4,5-tetrahydropyridine-2,6-dicarboxylate N-acetyltransferase [Synergistales bacterium]|nr:2,3,4,5-tetrahydropyridine-2,6-dicarboxylate N-acetyltransferase [Synergistales bacterium]